jgi:hypothetical protein
MIERKVRELLEDQSSVKISEVIAAIPEYKKEEKKFVKAALRKLGFRDRGYGIWTNPGKSSLNVCCIQQQENIAQMTGSFWKTWLSSLLLDHQ